MTRPKKNTDLACVVRNKRRYANPEAYELAKKQAIEKDNKIADALRYDSRTPVKKVVDNITDMVNVFGDKSPEFNKWMAGSHPTLQQSFTKLVFKWIEHCATDGYYTDGRNEWSQKICKELIQQFKLLPNHESTVPSQWLGMV